MYVYNCTYNKWNETLVRTDSNIIFCVFSHYMPFFSSLFLLYRKLYCIECCCSDNIVFSTFPRKLIITEHLELLKGKMPIILLFAWPLLWWRWQRQRQRQRHETNAFAICFEQKTCVRVCRVCRVYAHDSVFFVATQHQLRFLLLYILWISFQYMRSSSEHWERVCCMHKVQQIIKIEEIFEKPFRLLKTYIMI